MTRSALVRGEGTVREPRSQKLEEDEGRCPHGEAGTGKESEAGAGRRIDSELTTRGAAGRPG